MESKRVVIIAIVLLVVVAMGSAVFAANPASLSNGDKEEGDHSKNTSNVTKQDIPTNDNLDNLVTSDTEEDEDLEIDDTESIIQIGNSGNNSNSNASTSNSSNIFINNSNSNNTTNNGNSDNSTNNSNSGDTIADSSNSNNDTNNNTSSGSGGSSSGSSSRPGGSSSSGSNNNSNNNSSSENLDKVIEDIKDLINSDSPNISEITDKLKDIVDSLINNADIDNDKLKEIEDIIKDIQDMIDSGKISPDKKDELQEIIDEIKDTIEQIKVKEELQDEIQKLKDQNNNDFKELIDNLQDYINNIGTDKTVAETIKISDLKEDIIKQIEDLINKNPDNEVLKEILNILNNNTKPTVKIKTTSGTLANHGFTNDNVTLSIVDDKIKRIIINDIDILSSENNVFDIQYSNGNNNDNYDILFTSEKNYKAIVIDNSYNKVEVEFTIVINKPYIKNFDTNISENEIYIFITTSENLSKLISSNEITWTLMNKSKYFNSTYKVNSFEGTQILDTITLETSNTTVKYDIVLNDKNVYFTLVD